MQDEDNEPDESHPWLSDRYDLEEEEFVYQIVGMAQPIHLWDAALSYQEVLRDNPHRAFVVAVQYRLQNLLDRFKSLNAIERMLVFENFPLEDNGARISRYEWLRIVLDTMLARLTSIRDCAFLLTSQVLDLQLEPRQVTLRELSRRVSNQEILETLRKISEAGRDLRDERDRTFHRGEERPLSDGLDQIFRLLSFYEPVWGSQLGVQSESGERWP